MAQPQRQLELKGRRTAQLQQTQQMRTCEALAMGARTVRSDAWEGAPVHAAENEAQLVCLVRSDVVGPSAEMIAQQQQQLLQEVLPELQHASQGTTARSMCPAQWTLRSSTPARKSGSGIL
jgi:hypothetical protein